MGFLEKSEVHFCPAANLVFLYALLFQHSCLGQQPEIIDCPDIREFSRKLELFTCIFSLHFFKLGISAVCKTRFC